MRQRARNPRRTTRAEPARTINTSSSSSSSSR